MERVNFDYSNTWLNLTQAERDRSVSGPRRTKPVVVAVQGTCWTAGIELMLNADIVVADTTARFAHLEVLRGISPAGGSSMRRSICPSRCRPPSPASR